ncbi:FUSC family protein [Alicyclobacillus contaminans]|uniref:FUSC family protein n=1 Tax=Alicyclobacillus contaminans TaxID=392016 RepID=UPI0003FC98F2|nr:aromatic acid exporter family protein [Alicyclobacillus contaminans]
MKNVWTWLVRYSSIWKTALAAGISWELARWLGTTRPYFAPLAAILCLQVTVEESIWKGYQRVIGIVVGVLLAMGIVRWLGLHGWSLALIVLLGTGLATWIRLGEQAIPQVGVSAMMVMTVGGHGYGYGMARIVDTLLGAVVAILTNMFVLPPDYTPAARASVEAAGRELSQRFLRMGTWLRQGADDHDGQALQAETRRYLDELHDTAQEVGKAIRAVRFSPLVRRRRMGLERIHDALFHLRQGYAHAAGMMRTLLEWKAADGMDSADMAAWAERLDEVARQVRAWSAVLCASERAVVAALAEAPLHPREVGNALPFAVREAALWNDYRQLMEDFRLEVDPPNGPKTSGMVE